jgi:arginine/lysine/ornithine decarboxylase
VPAQVLQTSSPSYLLLASLDAARRHAQEPGVWAAPCAAAAAARAGLAQLPGLRLLQGGGCGSEASVAGFDPLRLVLNVAGRGWTGYEAATSLEQQHAIVPELATQQLVVFVFGPGSTLQDAERLVQGCSQLPQRQGSHASQAGAGSGDRSSSSSSSSSSSCCSTRGGSAHGSNCDAGSTQSSAEAQQLYAQAQPAAALTPRQAFNAATVAVPLAAAVGRVSAELLCPYPPGVPVVFPGERLSSSAVAVLQQTLAAGGTVVGAQDAALSSVLVVVEQQQ